MRDLFCHDSSDHRMQASYQYEVHLKTSDGATVFGYKAFILKYGNQEGSAQALISTGTYKGEAPQNCNMSFSSLYSLKIETGSHMHNKTQPTNYSISFLISSWHTAHYEAHIYQYKIQNVILCT